MTEQITIDGSALYRDRRRSVRRLLAPLLPSPPNAVVEQVGVNRNAYVIAAVPQGRNPTSFLNPHEPLIPTRVPKVLLNYYERWNLKAADRYFLDRVYLHVHLAGRSTSQQILALHCDPALEKSATHYRYKRGPHIHVEGATPLIDRAHISLCLRDDQLGGADLGSLMQTFGEAVQMIRAELFPCWERA